MIHLRRTERGIETLGGYDRRAEQTAAALTDRQDVLLDVIAVLEEVAAQDPNFDLAAQVKKAEFDRIMVRSALDVDGIPNPVTLAMLAYHSDPMIRARVPMRPEASVITLRALAKDSSQSVRTALAKRKQLPQELLLAMASHPDPETRIAVGERDDLPPDIERRLAHDPDPQIRAIFALNTNKAGLLEQLIEDENSHVRMAVLLNSSVPADVEEQLVIRGAMDPASKVRRMAARHELLPMELLSALIKDAQPEVWRVAAQSPRASKEDLLWLLSGKDPRDVATVVNGCPRARERVWLLEHMTEEQRLRVAETADQVEVQRALCEDASVEVRKCLARGHLKEVVARRLAHDPEVSVRRAMAEHSASASYLVDDPDPDIRTSARKTALQAQTVSGGSAGRSL